MSDLRTRVLPEGFVQGPIQGLNIIGEVTESLHRFLLDGWASANPPPRIEEDLSFVPKDREEVLYVYMYRAAQETALMNSKQWRAAKVSVFGDKNVEQVFYERAPLYLNLYYLIAVHSKFRSDAERLLGWVLMRLYDATHLVYRPRRYVLPDGQAVDSTGTPWTIDNEGENVIMEKVSLALVDDLTIGDAVNFYTINEAPFRPFLTYRAVCAMEGSLISGPPTTIRHHRAKLHVPDGKEGATGDRATGRIAIPSSSAASPPTTTIGPPGFGHRPIADDNESEE
ncbi:MAG: Pvc16 family protein [Myxococcota bacterium]